MSVYDVDFIDLEDADYVADYERHDVYVDCDVCVHDCECPLPDIFDIDQMITESAEPGEAGAVDAGVADCLVQIALFGEVVYG